MLSAAYGKKPKWCSEQDGIGCYGMGMIGWDRIWDGIDVMGWDRIWDNDGIG